MASTVTLRADAARNRELVLEAAGRLLRERGLDVTMQEIADAAGVGVGTVCRRFRSKDELVAALVQERFEQMFTLVRRGIERSQDAPWQAFHDVFEQAVELHVRDRGFMEAVAGHGYLADDRMTELRVRAIELLGELVDRGIAAGVVRPDLVAADVPELVCMVSRTGGCAMNRADAVARACTIVLDGIRRRD